MLDTGLRTSPTNTRIDTNRTDGTRDTQDVKPQPTTNTNTTVANTETTTDPAVRPTTETAANGRILTSNDPRALQMRAQLEGRVGSGEPATLQGPGGKDPALPGKDPTLPADAATGFTRQEGDAFRTAPDGTQVPPQYGDVDQGGLGDCWLMAASAAVAHTDPEYIQNRVSENPDGTFNVRLGDRTQRVDPTFPNAGYADPTPNGQANTLWPALVEKAYAQQEGNNYGNLDGGNPGRALEALTGQPTTRTAVSPTSNADDVWRTLQDGVTGDHPMVASTPGTGTTPPLHDNHAYAVLGATERDGQRYVQVYNPWGTNDNSRDLSAMTHEMTLEDFQKNFTNLYVSGG